MRCTMSDQLEKFIKDNRSHFDDLEPNPKNWEKIDARINRKRMFKLDLNILWRAAAILFLGISVTMWFSKIRETNDTSTQLSSEFNEVETFYATLIEQKKSELSAYDLQEYEQLEAEFLHEIENLDSVYSSLKKSYFETGSDKVMDAMIINLQTRIELLNQQLSILEKIKSTKNNEKAINT